MVARLRYALVYVGVDVSTGTGVPGHTAPAASDDRVYMIALVAVFWMGKRGKGGGGLCA